MKRRKSNHFRKKEEAPEKPLFPMRLNKYLSNAGLCSRRKADELIKEGRVKVNEKIVTEVGSKVSESDIVRFEGTILQPERKVYILLNKPKNVISTTQDERGRKTILNCINHKGHERLFPVGRLDRNTTGLILITNDGELTQKLTHPSSEVKKLYSVELGEPLNSFDLKQIKKGVLLEEGVAKVDDVAYVEGNDRRRVGVQIHMGWNRVVRRIFEKLGYEVKKLDRVMFAHLTKKDLPRGKWRYLSDREVVALKHFSVK